jgi:hypothetical protein
MGQSRAAGRVRSVRSAAAFADRAGIALVFPSDDLNLPSLWEAAIGTGELVVFVRERDGRRVLSPEMRRVWSLHERLATERLAVVGKHVRDRLAVISLDLLPACYALTGRAGEPDDFAVPGLLGALEGLLAAALLDDGPLTGPELRRVLGLRDPPRVKRALERLQRDLVITRAGEAAQAQGWDAAIFDLVARRFRARLTRLPARDEALALLAAAVLGSAGALSAADLARVLGCARGEAAGALDRLAGQGGARRLDGTPVRWTRAGQGAR